MKSILDFFLPFNHSNAFGDIHVGLGSSSVSFCTASSIVSPSRRADASCCTAPRTPARSMSRAEASAISSSIRKGNLDGSERAEIESHVTHTFQFLSKIPWTKELRHVPNIAYAHHEKVNGRGYPRALSSEEIPVQSRMMTISDIYDALTANDRPYKRAVPREKALDILKMEMKDGLLDPELVDLFIDAKVYEMGVGGGKQ